MTSGDHQYLWITHVLVNTKKTVQEMNRAVVLILIQSVISQRHCAAPRTVYKHANYRLKNLDKIVHGHW